jgi:UDP-N-acetylmuramoyl-tripeptide--D-alanyl-D-alanine ligase
MAQGLPRIDYVEAEAVTGGAMLRAKMLGREVQTHLVGAYNLDNLRAAATVGLQMGVSEEDICAALSDYVPSNNRSQFMHTAHNDLIVDAYNANPTSMAAALDNFEQMDAPHKMCILGMMGELGDDSRMEHERLLQRLQGMQLEEVWLVGSEFESLGSELSDPQSCPAVPQRRCGHIRFFPDVEAVKQAIAAQQPQGRTILIKGSNSTHLFQLPPLL